MTEMRMRIDESSDSVSCLALVELSCTLGGYPYLSRVLIGLYTLFYKNIVLPAQAEYSCFSADFKLKIYLCIFLD